MVNCSFIAKEKKSKGAGWIRIKNEETSDYVPPSPFTYKRKFLV